MSVLVVDFDATWHPLMMIANHFGLTTIDTGVLLGHALLCPDARYASLRLKDAKRLHRGFARPSDWRRIVEDLRAGWEKGLVDPKSATACVLVPSELMARCNLQQITAPPVEASAAGEAHARLDAYLLGLVL